MRSKLKAPSVKLGSSGPRVSRLIFGTEHIIDLTPEEGGAILADSYRKLGINHWDTAPAYASHPQVASGLEQAGRGNIVVTSKTSAATSTEAESELKEILDELGTDYLDIAFLHNVPTGYLERRRGALDHLLRAKHHGLVRHVGLSTHSPSVLAEAAAIPEVEIVCATLNRDGSRINDGTLDDMLSALKACYEQGKGVYVIKILGRGDLVDDLEEAIRFVCGYPFIHAYNIGMRNLREAEENLSLIMEHAPPVN